VRARLAASRMTVPLLFSRSFRQAAKPLRMACSQSAAVRAPTSNGAEAVGKRSF
jgi:hypothetical protein